MPAQCCPECFDDRGLRKHIFPTLSSKSGTCDYCRSSGSLLEPRQLADFFELLVNVYEPSPKGKPLVDWMKEDWLLFPHMDNAHAQVLLGEILDDGQIARKTFVPSPAHHSEGLASWEALRDEMMYRNRWFLDAVIDIDRLASLLDHLLADELPQRWYRARIRTGDTPYSVKEMGPPPKRLATHGRANPPGIPYLYLASRPETAAAELRPHTGEVTCVATFTLLAPLTAVDLRNPRKFVSPFVLADASAIGQLRADIPFLERLGDELTRPVQPQGAAIDYIPSQYLCELIKKQGYEGVVYRSSVSDGINLALFDATMARASRRVHTYNINRVTVDVAKG